MKPLTSEWVEKSEADYAAASREFAVRNRPGYDVVCFLAHQCAEKYLKARLQQAEIPFQKTHNLILLLDAVVPVEPLWEPLRESLDFLNTSAAGVRYPGVVTTKDVAEQVLRICTEVRRLAREALQLKDQAD
jgi:HEPN domain-containing protein